MNLEEIKQEQSISVCGSEKHVKELCCSDTMKEYEDLGTDLCGE